MTRYLITGNAREEAGGYKHPERKEDAKNKKDRVNREESPVEKTEDKKEKSSFKDALQQWSNDNARDIAEDNSTPLRSNL